MERLRGLADYYLYWKGYDLAGLAVSRLQSLDRQAAREVDYERAWRQRDYMTAFALYLGHRDWPDEIHVMQASALADLNKIGEARTVAARMEDGDARRSIEARLNYLAGDWSDHGAWASVRGAARKWYILELARADLKGAGQAVLAENLDDGNDIDVLRLLLRYHAEFGDSASMDQVARRLVGAIEAETAELGRIAHTALQNGTIEIARDTVTAIEKLDSQAAILVDLRREIARYETARISSIAHEHRSN